MDEVPLDFLRTTEWFGLEGTSKGPTPCHEQGHLQLDQVAQSPVQPERECFQGWGIGHLPGQPVLVPHHTHHNKFLPYIYSESLLL